MQQTIPTKTESEHSSCKLQGRMGEQETVRKAKKGQTPFTHFGVGKITNGSVASQWKVGTGIDQGMDQGDDHNVHCRKTSKSVSMLRRMIITPTPLVKAWQKCKKCEKKNTYL